MREILAVLVMVCMMVSAVAPAASAAQADIKVVVDGREIAQKGIAVQGRTLVPLRAVTEAFGWQVIWAGQDTVRPIQIYPVLPGIEPPAQGSVYSCYGFLGMKPGDANLTWYEYTVDEDSRVVKTGYEARGGRTGDVPAQVIGGVTYVPFRLLSEAVGCKVTWDGPSRTVFLEKPKDGRVMQSLFSLKLRRAISKDLIVNKIERVGNKIKVQVAVKNTGAGGIGGYLGSLNVPIRVGSVITVQPCVLAPEQSVVFSVASGSAVEVEAPEGTEIVIDPDNLMWDADRSNNTVTVPAP